MIPPWFIPLADLAARLETEPGGPRATWGVRHGTMRAGIYVPREVDSQTPHDQDEVYIVAQGSGVFVKAGERRPFAAGDLIFVEAGVEHRFEGFGEDFIAWVVFWGPKGGESA